MPNRVSSPPKSALFAAIAITISVSSLTSCASVRNPAKKPAFQKLSIEYSTFTEALEAVSANEEFRIEAKDEAWLIYLSKKSKLRWYFTREKNVAHPSLAKARLSPAIKFRLDNLKIEHNRYTISDSSGIRIVDKPKLDESSYEGALLTESVVACWSKQESCDLFEAAIEKFNTTLVNALDPGT